jgi:serine/threonine-protein kinase HipA
MYTPVDVIEVRIWGERVGAVAMDPRVGYYVFEYEPAWTARGIELAPLTMPLSRTPYVFTTLPEITYKRLPAMLADSLPDDFGNALIDAYLSTQGVTREAVTPLDRLAYMANRGVGALEFRPARGPRHRKASAVELSDLVTGSRQLLHGNFSGDREIEAAILQLIQVGTSAGGARPKAVIAWNPATGEIRSGQLPADPGFEYWLLKLDGVGRDHELGTGSHYGRVEYAYYLMARAAGLAMMESRLLEEHDRAHFMTRRFDRVGDEKVHVQSLCAMAHLDYKQRGTHDYNQYFQVIQQLQLGAGALEQGFRRMVFNVMAANCDDHSKNLGFILSRHEGWRLSPDYDVTHAHNPKGQWTYQHLMSVNGKFRDIQIQDLLAVADRFLVPRFREVIREVAAAVERWPEFAAAAGVPRAIAQSINADFAVRSA